jgi:hypothetical protein
LVAVERLVDVHGGLVGLFADIGGVGPEHLLLDVGFGGIDLEEPEVVTCFNS